MTKRKKRPPQDLVVLLSETSEPNRDTILVLNDAALQGINIVLQFPCGREWRTTEPKFWEQ